LRGVRERPARRDVSPELIVAGKNPPQVVGALGAQLFKPAVAALPCHRAGPRCRRRLFDRQADGLTGLRMWFGSRHDDIFSRSSLKNLFSSWFVIRPAKPLNLPSFAISVAVLIKACMATRASEPPTLIRRTPMAARSPTVKPKSPLPRKFTGFGATALTTASI